MAILGVEPDDTKLPDELGVKDSTFALLAVAFLVAVVAPIAEEFFFRGFFFTALRNWKGLWPAAVITGAGLRRDPRRLGRGRLPAAAGLLRLRAVPALERTGSLYPCIALHCVNNSLAFGVSQDWGWEIPVLFACALALISLVGARGPRARGRRRPAPAG